MSFFSKLFGKKNNPEPEPVLGENDVMTPLGVFTFVDYEYIYEGNVDWNNKDGNQIGAYIESVEEGSRDMGDGVERLIQLLENKEEVDLSVKMAALDYLADESGLIMNSSPQILMSKENFLDKMKIEDVGVKRDGSFEFTIYDCDIDNIESMYITYTDKGTFEFEIHNYDDE